MNLSHAPIHRPRMAGYLSARLPSISSRAVSAAVSLTAVYTGTRSLPMAPQSLLDAYRNVLRIRWMMHVCTTASCQTTPTAVERAVGDLPVPDLDVDRVDEHDGVHRVQRARRPLVHLLHDPVGDAADSLLGDGRPVDLLEMRGYLPAGEPLGVQGQHDRVHVVQAALALPGDDGLERAVPVARHLDLDGADRVGHDRLHCGAVTRVRGPAHHASLMPAAAEMFGHLLVQGGLQHGPGELFQQAVGTGQVEALLLRPADHLQRELPLGRGRRRRPALPWLRRGLLADGRLRCHGRHCLSRHAHHRPFPAGPATGDPEANYTLSETLPMLPSLVSPEGKVD